MKMLRITKCSDSLMWYSRLVGDLVPYCGQWPEAFKSLEPAGFLNRVEFEDAEIVEVLPDGRVVTISTADLKRRHLDIEREIKRQMKASQQEQTT